MASAPTPPQMAHVSDYYERSRTSLSPSPFAGSNNNHQSRSQALALATSSHSYHPQSPSAPWPGSNQSRSSPSTARSAPLHMPGSPSSRSSISTNTRQSGRGSPRAGSVYLTRPDDSMLGREQRQSSPRREQDDLEKQMSSPMSDPFRSPVPVPQAHITKMTYDRDEGEEEEDLEGRAMRLLIYLSGPCTIVSFGLTLWTFLAVIIAILLQPLRLCARRQCFTDELNDLLGPPLRLQLRLIYSFASSDRYSTPMLLAIHLLAPVLSIGVNIASWTAAFFWFYAGIIGDPSSGEPRQRREKRNDGRETVLRVRNWWEGWLLRAYR